MSKNKLRIGEIYITEWDERPFRVIGFDDIEVFYDCIRSHHDSWAFSSNLKNNCSFYRTSTSFFISKSKPIDYLPITEAEQIVFRPDLPIRLCRSKDFNWIDFYSLTIKELQVKVENLTDTIQTEKLTLIPFGNKGGLKKGVIISADNSEYFEASELIWKAKEILKSVNSQISKGVGIYRLGFEKGYPSYYIGEYFDKAGLLNE
jgi:hypothetical protein